MTIPILKPIFIDNKLNEFTSSKKLHYLSDVVVLKENNKKLKWKFSHDLGNHPIVIVVDKNNLQVIPEKIIHSLGKVEVYFNQPQQGSIILINSNIII